MMIIIIIKQIKLITSFNEVKQITSETSKLEDVKKYYVIRNAEFNWD